MTPPRAPLTVRSARFTIPGRAIPRPDNRNDPGYQQRNTDHLIWRRDLENAARYCADELRLVRPVDTACRVHVTFYLPRPSRRRRFHAQQPGLHTLLATVLPALVEGGLIANPARVIDLHLQKAYAEKGEAGRTDVLFIIEAAP